MVKEICGRCGQLHEPKEVGELCVVCATIVRRLVRFIRGLRRGIGKDVGKGIVRNVWITGGCKGEYMLLSTDADDEVRDKEQDDIKLLDELDKQLKLKAGGANIHTANTVVFYVYNNGTGVFNQKRFDHIKPFITNAINNGKWRDLRLAMDFGAYREDTNGQT